MSTNNTPDGPGAMPEGERANLIRQRALLAYALSNDHHGERNYYEVFGWNRDPSPADYYVSYLRNDYAKPIVNKPPETCWRDPPEIVDNAETDAGSDEETDTPFEADVEAFVDGCDPWHYCKRADVLQGIGEFGVLLIGWADGEDNFAKPVNRTALARNDPDELVSWFRPLSQLSVEKIRYGDTGSDRYGQPEYYRIDLADADDADTQGIFGDGESEQWFHHERVQHWAEGLLDDEIRGTPRQQSCFNTLTDIQKTMGSAAETAYGEARPALHYNIDKDYNLLDDGQKARESFDKFVHDQEPGFVTQGGEVERIAGETVDPTPITETQIQALCAATGMPRSVLLGKEVADRAKSEDLNDWYGDQQGRREQFLRKKVRDLIHRAVTYGGLSAPAGGPWDFDVSWVPLFTESEQDKADVILARSKAAKNLQSLMPAYGTDEWIEVVEEGTFPDVPDDAASGIEPADLAEFEQWRQNQDAPPAQPFGSGGDGQQPAIADGGSDSDENGDE